jgi:hypothetical protein
MAKKEGAVPRPLRRTEYVLRFATREAEKGWTDLVATALNAAVVAWEFLTQTPTAEDGRECYRLAGQMAQVTIAGQEYDRWQFKPTSGGRIWYAVIPPQKKDRGIVLLERVATGHPNETIKHHR